MTLDIQAQHASFFSQLGNVKWRATVTWSLALHSEQRSTGRSRFLGIHNPPLMSLTLTALSFLLLLPWFSPLSHASSSPVKVFVAMHWSRGVMSQAEFPAGGMKAMMKPRGFFFFSPPLFSPAFFPVPLEQPDWLVTSTHVHLLHCWTCLENGIRLRPWEMQSIFPELKEALLPCPSPTTGKRPDSKHRGLPTWS